MSEAPKPRSDNLTRFIQGIQQGINISWKKTRKSREQKEKEQLEKDVRSKRDAYMELAIDGLVECIAGIRNKSSAGRSIITWGDAMRLSADSLGRNFPGNYSSPSISMMQFAGLYDELEEALSIAEEAKTEVRRLRRSHPLTSRFRTKGLEKRICDESSKVRKIMENHGKTIDEVRRGFSAHLDHTTEQAYEIFGTGFLPSLLDFLYSDRLAGAITIGDSQERLFAKDKEQWAFLRRRGFIGGGKEEFETFLKNVIVNAVINYRQSTLHHNEEDYIWLKESDANDVLSRIVRVYNALSNEQETLVRVSFERYYRQMEAVHADPWKGLKSAIGVYGGEIPPFMRSPVVLFPYPECFSEDPSKALDLYNRVIVENLAVIVNDIASLIYSKKPDEESNILGYGLSGPPYHVEITPFQEMQTKRDRSKGLYSITVKENEFLRRKKEEIRKLKEKRRKD